MHNDCSLKFAARRGKEKARRFLPAGKGANPFYGLARIFARSVWYCPGVTALAHWLPHFKVAHQQSRLTEPSPN
jgi:hypothetical protein